MENRKLHTFIERHCLAVEFITQLELGDAEAFQDMFGKFLRTVGGFPNTDERGKQFGRACVYYNTKTNSANTARALPGSRGKGNDRDERGKGKGDVRNANLTNGGIPIGELIITKGKKRMMSIAMVGEIELMRFYSQGMRTSLQFI